MRAYTGLLKGSFRRELGPLLVSGIGIVIGVASLVLFLRVGLGLREHVINDMVGQLPVGTVELKAEKGSALLGFLTGGQTKGMGPTIDAAKLEALSKNPSVTTIHPRLRVDFPMIAWGLQKELRLPKPMAVDVFASGLPEKWVQTDLGEGKSFADPGRGKVIPVLISERLLALANGALAATIRVEMTPELVTGLRFSVMLGRSYMTGSKRDPRARTVQMEIVGVSRFATTLGFSVPAETAARWNEEFGRPALPVEGAWVVLDSPQALNGVVREARELGIAVDDSQRMVGLALDGILAVLVLVSGLLLALAAMIVSQTFYARVAMRRGEYALYRALGAKRSTLVAVVLSEAAIVGLICGVLGIALASGVGGWIEAAGLELASELPLAPKALLSGAGFASLCGMAVAIGFAVLGAARPAWRAASADPAKGLGL